MQLDIDDLTIESAKSSLAYQTAAKESTITDAVRLLLELVEPAHLADALLLAGRRIIHQRPPRASCRLRSQALGRLRGASCSIPRSLSPTACADPLSSPPLSSSPLLSPPLLSCHPLLQSVTAADILRVIKKYISPIFSPDTSIASVASGLAKLDELADKFTELGYDVEKRSMATVNGEEESGSEEEGSESGSETGSESESESERD